MSSLLLHKALPKKYEETLLERIVPYAAVILKRGLIIRNFYERYLRLGYPSQVVLNSKTTLIVICMLAGIAVTLLMRPVLSLILFSGLLGALTGFIIPELLVAEFEKQAQFELYGQIPMLFTLIYFALESETYARPLDALVAISHSVGGRLERMIAPLMVGQTLSTKEALYTRLEQNITDPLFVESIHTMRVADEFGSSLTAYFKDLSKSAYSTRLLKTKEIGMKASGLLLMPLVIFYMPIITILLLAPAVLGFMRSL